MPIPWFQIADAAISAASSAANKKRTPSGVPPPVPPGSSAPVEDILGSLERRGGSTGGGYKGAGKGALQGASYGSYVPGLGTAVGAGIGAIVGGIKGAVQKHAKTAPGDVPVEKAKAAIASAMQKAGRTPQPGEIDTMLRGQGWEPEKGDRWVGEGSLRYVLNTIVPKTTGAKPAAPAAATGPGGLQPQLPIYQGTRGAPANPQRQALQATEDERRREMLINLLRK